KACAGYLRRAWTSLAKRLPHPLHSLDAIHKAGEEHAHSLPLAVAYQRDNAAFQHESKTRDQMIERPVTIAPYGENQVAHVVVGPPRGFANHMTDDGGSVLVIITEDGFAHDHLTISVVVQPPSVFQILQRHPHRVPRNNAPSHGFH